VGHGEILLHLSAQNMSGNEAGEPFLGQKGEQNKDIFVFTP
jgi:hypothetical protein